MDQTHDAGVLGSSDFGHSQVHLWMAKEDTFPNFGGQVDIKDLSFHIWEAPSEFKVLFFTSLTEDQSLQVDSRKLLFTKYDV